MRSKQTAAFGILFVLLPLASTRSCAFVAPRRVAATRIVCSPAAAAKPDSNNAENDNENEEQQLPASSNGSPSNRRRLFDTQQSHERAMEELSAQGSARIAQLSIAERTKRAMLAEAVEDQIFEYTEELEELLTNSGSTSSSAKDSEVIENRKYAVALAQQTKALQVQYRELVSGEPSSVLNALENAMGGEGGGASDDGQNEQGDDVLK